MNQPGRRARGGLNFLLLAVLVVTYAAALTSCASNKVEVPREVYVEVSTSCVRDRPTKPAMRSEADLLTMDRYRRTIAAWQDLKKWEAYGAELEAVVTGCALPLSTRPRD